MSTDAKRLTGGEVVRAARRHVEDLTGRRADTISGLTRLEEGGWTVAVEVVELERIPSSTDVLASYEVTLDDDGELIDLQRSRRYFRNQADGD